jgi:hypothetical protein
LFDVALAKPECQLVRHSLGEVGTPNAERAALERQLPKSFWSKTVLSHPVQATNMALGTALAVYDALPNLNSRDPQTRQQARNSLSEAVGLTVASVGAPKLSERVVAPATAPLLRTIFRGASQQAVAGITGGVTQFGIGTVLLHSLKNSTAVTCTQYEALRAQMTPGQGKASPAELVKTQRQMDLAAFRTSLSSVTMALAGTSMGIQAKSHSIKSRVLAGTLDTAAMGLALGSAVAGERTQAYLGSGLRHVIDGYDTADRYATEWYRGLSRETRARLQQVGAVGEGAWDAAGSVVGEASAGVDWVGERVWSGVEWTARKGWDNLGPQTQATIGSKATSAWDGVTGWLGRQRQNLEDYAFGPETTPSLANENPTPAAQAAAKQRRLSEGKIREPEKVAV